MDVRLSSKTIYLLFIILLTFKFSLEDCTFQSSVHIKETLAPDSKIFTFPSDSHVSILEGPNEFYVLDNKLFCRHRIQVNSQPTKRFKLRLTCTTNNKIKVKKDFTITASSPDVVDATSYTVKSLSVDIPETTSVNSSVVNLSSFVTESFDNNTRSGWNNSTVYTIKMNSYNDTFVMGDPQKGIILLKKKLDYDIRNIYQLNISALNGENLVFVLLTIAVKDEDTKPPVFAFLHYYASVEEEAVNLINTTLTSAPPILAYDGDRSINQTINYRMHKGTKAMASDAFDVDNRTGSIILRQILNRETKDSYTIYIEAYQTDAPYTKTAIAVAHITVLDINDNLPKFGSYFQSVEVLENLPKGFFIYRFHATDADKVPFNIFQYQLKDKYDAFQVNGSTGELTVKNSRILDRETHPTLVISVFAVERSGQKSKSCYLTITLLDVNDNWPMFSQQGFLLFATELTNGTFIGTVNASDRDVGLNAILKYGLTNIVEWGKQPAPIDIEENTGVITANSFLKPATSYRFFLQACDSPRELSRRLCSKVPVMIVTKNTTKPENNSRVKYIYIKENTPRNTTVADLKDDFKGSSTGMIFIHLKTSPVPVKIMKFGEVVVNGLLDYEAVQQYKLTVLACTETKTINMTVFVHIKDINDHIPTFDKPVYIFEVLPKLEINTTIGYISASDNDKEPPNNQFFYKIPAEFSVGRHIVIENKTGELIVKRSLQLEAEEENGVEFLVRVIDEGNPPLSSLVKVKLVLEDKITGASYFVSTMLLKKQVLNNKRSLEWALTKATGVRVTIVNVIDGPTDSLGQSFFFGGSTVQITATFPNGTKLSRQHLKSLVLEHKDVLQKIFKEKSSKKLKSWNFHAPELSLLILACLLFICCLICVSIIYMKQKEEVKNRHIVHNCKKNRSLYDSTDLTVTTDINGPHEISSNSTRSNRPSIINHTFEFDSDSGRHSNESKTNQTDETDTGFQTSTLSVSKRRCRRHSKDSLETETQSRHPVKSARMLCRCDDSDSQTTLNGNKEKHTYENVEDSSDSESEKSWSRNIYDKPDKSILKGKYPESISGLYDASDENMYEIPNTVSSSKDSLYEMYDKPDSPQTNNFYDFVDDPSLKDLFRENINESDSDCSHIYSNVVTHHYEHISSDSDIPSEPHPDYITTGSEFSDLTDEPSYSRHGSLSTLSYASTSTSHYNSQSDLHSTNKFSKNRDKTLHKIIGLLELSHSPALSSRGHQACPLPPRDYNTQSNQMSHFKASMTQL
ncbi:cadherin-23-like [Octopus sinensis]|uniref:Cadherin-23-like n=1 Tax=Octopus sinensis TaxID=2607531 RepID=A0A7E6FK70_9MOLL|nr:cadherin-23-like [Octopus sinensis]